MKKYKNATELAAEMKVDPKVIEATFNTYNDAA